MLYDSGGMLNKENFKCKFDALSDFQLFTIKHLLTVNIFLVLFMVSYVETFKAFIFYNIYKKFNWK